jgi:acetate kinase
LRILVVNAGSSSIKLSLLGDRDETLAERELAAAQTRVDPEELSAALALGLAEADVVAHRIVHGGERFRSAVRIDREVERELRALSDLAPLHQAKSLAALDAISAALPKLPAFGCFDTAFHVTLPPEASTYALPAAWRERWGVRRYGFHGLSHAWVARRATALLNQDPAWVRIVSCHLGSGASLCAIRAGRSIDTTMGFTPLEGLVMATRAGNVDPGLLLWLLERENLTGTKMAHALEHDSGLRGLAGTGDMRAVLDRASSDDTAATLALGVYLHRLRAAICSMAAALGGLDALVFTGGVGERSATIRARAADGLAFLGVRVDQQRNRHANSDADISAERAPVRTLVIAAREDLEIATQVRALHAGKTSTKAACHR